MTENTRNLLGLVLAVAVLVLGVVLVTADSAPAAGKVEFMGHDKKAMLWGWYRTSGAECIGAHEGGWTSNTGNGYYGRFQANEAFAKGYGRHYHKRIHYWNRWGDPSNWPHVLQIHMARHGWKARGWSPWPNTARACGLL